jgi:hypothetical protein
MDFGQKNASWPMPHSDTGAANYVISPENRADILQWLRSKSVDPSGETSIIEFLETLIDLDSLPSEDSRYDTLRGELIQHTELNNDYDWSWMYFDHRLNLRAGDPEFFLKFLCRMLHP